MSHIVPVKNYTSAAEIIAARRALKEKFFGLNVKPLLLSEEAAEAHVAIEASVPTAPIEARRDWIDLATPQALKPSDSRLIINLVSAATGVSLLDLRSLRRTNRVALARQMACWLIRHHTTLSFPRIGSRLGGRDHTTVLHAVRRVTEKMENDPDFQALMHCISAQIEKARADG